MRAATTIFQDELKASVKFSMAPLETECRGTLSNVERITAKKGCYFVEGGAR